MAAQQDPPLRIVGAALGAGSTLFLLIALLLPSSVGDLPAGEGAGSLDVLQHLSVIHALAAVTGLALAMVLPPRIRARHAATGGTPGASWIVRWALLEFGALFGLTVLLLAGLWGALETTPLLYANIASYFVFMAVLIVDLTSDLR